MGWEEDMNREQALFLKKLEEAYGPRRANMRSQLIASGVDPSSSLGASSLGDVEKAQQEQATDFGTQMIGERMRQRRLDEQLKIQQEGIAQAQKDKEDAKRQGKRAFWGKLIGTLGGAALSAIPGAGTLAGAGFKGFLGRFLGGAGSMLGGTAGGMLAGGGDMEGEGNEAYDSPLARRLSKRYSKFKSPGRFKFGADVPNYGAGWYQLPMDPLQ